MTATEPTVADPHRLLVENLAVIDRILGIIARRHALSTEVAEEFSSWAKARLVDSDYSILRRFGGRSSLSTYLTVVLTNLFRDFRNQEWGRWRPSARSQRLGPVAIQLEQLVQRDGCSVREAIAILQSRGVVVPDGELSRIATHFPARVDRQEVDITTVDPAATEPAAGEEADRRAVSSALQSALSSLNDEDRLILRLHYWDDASVADIARVLRIEQKPLYRRLEGIAKRLRDLLSRAGITEERARDVLAGERS